MTDAALICLLLCAGALLAVPMPDALPQLTGRPAGWRETRLRCIPAPWRRALVVGGGVVAVGALLDLWPWWLGIVLGTGAGAAVVRLPSRRSSADRTQDRRRLARHADVLAACLDAGMSVGAALLAVRSQAPGPEFTPGRDEEDPVQLLDGVAALLMLGADPDRAWRSVQGHPDLASLAAAARRSAVGGAGFAEAVREHAVNLRAAGADASQRSAGRAGVAMTAPLGICFLPAFLCLGLAPVVLGLLSTLNLF